MLDALIILGYFTAIMIVAVRARLTKELPFTGLSTNLVVVGVWSLVAGIALTGVSVGLRVAEAQVQRGSHRRLR